MAVDPAHHDVPLGGDGPFVWDLHVDQEKRGGPAAGTHSWVGVLKEDPGHVYKIAATGGRGIRGRRGKAGAPGEEEIPFLFAEELLNDARSAPFPHLLRLQEEFASGKDNPCADERDLDLGDTPAWQAGEPRKELWVGILYRYPGIIY